MIYYRLWTWKFLFPVWLKQWSIHWTKSSRTHSHLMMLILMSVLLKSHLKKIFFWNTAYIPKLTPLHWCSAFEKDSNIDEVFKKSFRCSLHQLGRACLYCQNWHLCSMKFHVVKLPQSLWRGWTVRTYWPSCLDYFEKHNDAYVFKVLLGLHVSSGRADVLWKFSDKSDLRTAC